MNYRTQLFRRGLASGALIAVAGLAGLTAPAGAQSLGSAENFAVLGASTVTNTGATVINGNVGVSPGPSIIGFPPGIVMNGALHAADGPATAAHADFATAYTAFAGLASPAANNLTDRDLGGMTLTPGVYRFNTAATSNGVLTFDAQGDPEARFVVQIGTTFITSGDSSVALINGAEARNVFFQVGTSATLGSGSQFTGNILAYAAVTAVGGTNVVGRLLALTEAVTMDTNRVIAPLPCTAPPAGMISWWAAEGNGNDLLGSNLAVLQNGAGYATAGQVDKAFAFSNQNNDENGQFAQVTAPVGMPLGNSARTIELWFKTAANFSDLTEAALVQYGSETPDNLFGLITSSQAPGKLSFSANNNDLAGTTTLQADTWYHAAVTYDGNSVMLYLNGVLETSKLTTSLNTMLDKDGLTFGRRPGVSTWNGQLDEIAIYGRALSQGEIQAVHAAGEMGKCRPALELAAVASRKIHGNAGAFDIALPPIGEPGVECRTGGADGVYTLVYTFSNSIVSANAQMLSGGGFIEGSSFDGLTMTVHLANVTDVQKITVNVSDATDAVGQVFSTLATQMNVLVGDTNGNRTVNSSDIGQAKSQSGLAANAGNFRNDVTANGMINSSDLGQIRANSGHTLDGVPPIVESAPTKTAR